MATGMDKHSAKNIVLCFLRVVGGGQPVGVLKPGEVSFRHSCGVSDGVNAGRMAAQTYRLPTDQA